jgi:hypothetical protein
MDPRVASRLTTELDELTRRFLAMALVDQHEFAVRVGQILNLERPLLDDEGVKRKETIACLCEAAAHLGLDRPLTKDEYEAAQKELHLPWSWQRIGRLWRSYALAARAAAGGPLPRSWQERDFKRRFLAGKNARSREEYLTAVRLWLATKPPTERGVSYDEFVREHNLTLEDGGLPLPRLSTVTKALGLRFAEVVAIAKGEQELPTVVEARSQDADWSRGPDDLVGLRTLALLCGGSQHQARRLTMAPDFPRPVLRVCGRRIWLRAELSAYLAGERLPLQPPERLRERYLTAGQAAALLAVKPTTLIRSPELPRMVAQVASIYRWLRDDVEGYANAREDDIAGRREGRRPEPRSRTQFVTLSSLARELGMGYGQVTALAAEDGFPTPLQRFDGGGVWAREEVESYLKGQPSTPAKSALGELLMDAPAITEFMALKASVRRNQYGDLPEPVARIKSGNVYLRNEVEAILEADPAARARLERRRRRQEASSSSSQASVSSGEG